MDFDGDGTVDILSGSYAPKGDLYFFKGTGGGKFAKGETLKDKGGSLLAPGTASTVFMFDWNGDGRRDLLCGNISGGVLVYLNEGTSGNNVFGAPITLTTRSKSLKPSGGDTHPIAADWDEDGLPDLLLGHGNGSVTFHRNIGSRNDPKLAAGVYLVSAPALDFETEDEKPPADVPGYRSKVCATDWNGDGHLDLLVGDFSSYKKPLPGLTDDQKAERKRIKELMTEIQRELKPYWEELARLRKPGGDDSDPSSRALERSKIDQKYKPVLERLIRAEQSYMKFEGEYSSDGFVWLFLRAPVTSARR